MKITIQKNIPIHSKAFSHRDRKKTRAPHDPRALGNGHMTPCPPTLWLEPFANPFATLRLGRSMMQSWRGLPCRAVPRYMGPHGSTWFPKRRQGFAGPCNNWHAVIIGMFF